MKGTEKKIDTNVVTDVMFDALTRMDKARDEITLVAGDSDYVPMVEKLIAQGFRVHVVFWGHASRELQAAARSFTPLDKHLDFLKR